MKNREGQRRLDVWIDEEAYTAMKIYEAINKKEHVEVVNAALYSYLSEFVIPGT
jgi:hypothetical protein